MRTKARALAGVFAAAALAAAAGTAASAGAASVCPLPKFGPGHSYRPQINKHDFSPNVDNPWFPLKPGRVLVYSGTKDTNPALNVQTATNRTKVIDGVNTRVVEDRLYLDNVLEEKTSDYYTQDRCGNVWYFGEDTAELDANGKVTSREGSFHAGIGGAQPGVFMQAHPEIGREFRQEWLRGQAEDRYTALGVNASAKVPAGSFQHALRTKEQTDLEPEVLDNKVYVKGIGEVIEVAVKGPVEKLVLVEVIE